MIPPNRDLEKHAVLLDQIASIPRVKGIGQFRRIELCQIAKLAGVDTHNRHRFKRRELHRTKHRPITAEAQDEIESRGKHVVVDGELRQSEERSVASRQHDRGVVRFAPRHRCLCEVNDFRPMPVDNDADTSGHS